jgi:hypothetical protein
MDTRYDAIVVGGGTAGVVAAIQAGRAGARTLLIEKTGILGGTMVTGGINAPASFRAYGKQVIAGIGWELCCKALRECGENIPELNAEAQKAGRPEHIRVNAGVFAAICDEALLDAKVDLLFHAMPAAVAKVKNGWKLTICTKTGLRKLQARVLIDCTGDANVAELAGCATCRSKDLQPATLVVKVSGYDDTKLDYAAIDQAFAAEVAAGRMKASDPGWGRGKMSFFLRGYGGNRIHMPDVDGRTSEGKTQAEIEGRRAMLRVLRFCRKQPGLERFKVDYCAVEAGIRETVTIKAKTTVRIKDYEAGRRYSDAVCYSFYPVDIHRPDYIEGHPLPINVVPTIPLRAMLPKDSQFIIVAGRCVAGDQQANSSFRVEAPCMAMGQAAGAAAALAARLGMDFEEIPIKRIHDLLREHGAIVPE